MITIIKMGQIPITTPDYRTTCNYCNTIFEHRSSDNQFELNYKGQYVEKVVCPLCKTKILPQKIKQPPDVPKPVGPLIPYELTSDYTIVHQQTISNCPKKD